MTTRKMAPTTADFFITFGPYKIQLYTSAEVYSLLPSERLTTAPESGTTSHDRGPKGWDARSERPIQPEPLNLWLSEQRVLQVRVHCYLFDDHTMGVFVPIDGRLQDEGNHHALHRPEVALVDPYIPHLAVHAARCPLDFHVEVTASVNPDVLHIAILGGELQLVRVTTRDRLDSLEVHLRSLRRIVDKRT